MDKPRMTLEQMADADNKIANDAFAEVAGWKKTEPPRIEIERETITNMATGDVMIKKTELKAVCASCKWHNIDPHFGWQCRRHSPVVGKHVERVWPYVFETDWCGDWDRGDWDRNAPRHECSHGSVCNDCGSVIKEKVNTGHEFFLEGPMQFDEDGTVWVGGETLYNQLKSDGLDIGYRQQFNGRMKIRIVGDEAT